MKIAPVVLLVLFNSFFISVHINAQQDELKVYISVDMEGITGLVDRDQVTRGEIDYQMARRWTTQETNAAVEGALDAGATYVLVNDSHGSMRNIILEELHPEARLITGRPKPYAMMEGIDETFDAIVFIGYHARGGTLGGVLDHTYSSASVFSIKINGFDMPELGPNALLAGHYGVPIVLVTGDRATCEQAQEILGDEVVTVPVKEGIGWSAAKTLSLEKAHRLIREKTKEAILKRDRIQPYSMEKPYKFEITFLRSHHAENPSLIPGVKRIDGRTVRFTTDDAVEGYKLMRALIALAGTG